MDQAEKIRLQVVNKMNNKNYISEIHFSRDILDNVYFFLSINEKQLLKDSSEFSKYFSESELDSIFDQVVSRKILLQDSSLRTYLINDFADLTTVQISKDQKFITYLITLKNKNIEFPCRLIFNYSFKFRYYKFLEKKIPGNEALEKSDLYREIADYDESTLTHDKSEITRHTISIITPDIDFRIYDKVKERVHFASSQIVNKNSIILPTSEEDGYSAFDKIVVDNKSFIIGPDENEKIKYFQKLINNANDYDYKRFLNNKSIFIKLDSKEIMSFSLPTNQRTNLANTSSFSDDDVFLKEAIKLKTDESKEKENLFLLFSLINSEIIEPKTNKEKESYNEFLKNSFKYSDYFFNHILKFNIEYLSNILADSMSEVWSPLTQEVFLQPLNPPILCRINLKNKKYYDRIAYEYFLLEG